MHAATGPAAGKTWLDSILPSRARIDTNLLCARTHVWQSACLPTQAASLPAGHARARVAHRYPKALLTPVHRARGHGECGEAADCTRALTREPRARREAGAAGLRGWGGRPGRGRDGRGGQAAGGAGALSRPLGAARRPPPPPPPQPGARRPGRSWRRPQGADSPSGPAPEAGPGQAGRPGGEDAEGGCPHPAARPAPPRPPPARPRGRASAGAQLPPDTAGRDAAGPGRCGPSASNVRESAEGLGRKGPQSLPLAPISRTRPPRPERGRSLRARQGPPTWLRPLPTLGPEQSGVMPRAANPLFCPRAGARRGQAPFPGIGGGKLRARASAPRPPAEPRAALAHSRRPRSRPPSARVPGLPGRPPAPQIQAQQV